MTKLQKLISWVEEIRENNHSSGASLYIIKDNEVILEHYSGHHSNVEGSKLITETSQFNVASARKSYLGLAVAFAIYEKKIKSLDDLAIHYFREYDPELLGQTTIRHLVTHTHGLNETPDGKIVREFEPGQGWAYRGVNIVMMTNLIKELYGKSLVQLLEERVFSRLGLKETAWQVKENDDLVKVVLDPNQEATYNLGQTNDGSESNLHVSAREFAIWGNLHLNKGIWNEEQIIPSGVIELAIQVHSPDYASKTLPKNGLFWFVQGASSLNNEIGERVPEGSFQIVGISGPTILVIPKYKVVVAKMYNKRYNYGGDNYLYYLREFSNLVADVFA